MRILLFPSHRCRAETTTTLGIHYMPIKYKLFTKQSLFMKKNLKTELSHESAIALFPEETIIEKDTCATMLTTALFTNDFNVHPQMNG